MKGSMSVIRSRGMGCLLGRIIECIRGIGFVGSSMVREVIKEATKKNEKENGTKERESGG